MIMQLKEPFCSLWSKGYLRESKDGRKRVDLVNSYTERTTISYARYLMCVEVGYILSSDYEVDHKDQDPTNDALVNLQILTLEEHRIKTANESKCKEYVDCECACCGLIFSREKRLIRYGKTVCSRSCNGKLNSSYIRRIKSYSDEQVSRILELKSSGLSNIKVANITGMHRSMVARIVVQNKEPNNGQVSS